jgi:hypothetical protein
MFVKLHHSQIIIDLKSMASGTMHDLWSTAVQIRVTVILRAPQSTWKRQLRMARGLPNPCIILSIMLKNLPEMIRKLESFGFKKVFIGRENMLIKLHHSQIIIDLNSMTSGAQLSKSE